MTRKFTLLIWLVLIGILSVSSEVPDGEAAGIIYIRPDGSVDPDTAPISSVDNITYTLTGNISGSIVVERSDIVIDGAEHTVEGNGTGYGFSLIGISNVTVTNTGINNFYSGVILNWTSYCSVSGNNITDNVGGVWLYVHASNNDISENNIKNNIQSGIALGSECSNNVISRNNIANSSIGVGWGKYSNNNNIISQNTITNNSEGISCYDGYYSGNNTFASNNIRANRMYGINLRNSSSNTIVGNTITNNTWYGIDLAWCFDNIISENNITKQELGLNLEVSGSNIIVMNTIAENSIVGIGLSFQSSDNVLSKNMVTSNNIGIGVSQGSGWMSGPSSNNQIYHNNLFDNIVQASVEYSNPKNLWDDGYPSGGNYWSDYAGNDTLSGPYQNKTGSDGIGDTPYIIDENNTDRYPLMNEHKDFSFKWESKTYPIDVDSDSTTTEFSFSREDNMISFKVGGPDGTVGFCNVTIPREFMEGTSVEWTVLVDDVPVMLAVTWNITHTSIYFTYNHSIHIVKVLGSLDITPPVISVLSPENKTYATAEIPLTFTVDESVSWMAYSLDGQANVTIAGNTTMSVLSDGSHSLTVCANDTAGNTGASDTSYFTLDTKQPEPFPTLIVGVAIATVAITSAAIAVFWRRRKQQPKNSVRLHFTLCSEFVSRTRLIRARALKFS